METDTGVVALPASVACWRTWLLTACQFAMDARKGYLEEYRFIQATSPAMYTSGCDESNMDCMQLLTRTLIKPSPSVGVLPEKRK